MVCYWCGLECGGTCLSLSGSTQMKTADPAYFLLTDGVTSTPKVYSGTCYICNDPEFAQMGLPLCNPCFACGGHVAADDDVCAVCSASQFDLWQEAQMNE